jgi:23S rRNA (cytosine1962-C5)-methyltransferase
MVLRVLSRDPERSPALPNGAASVATEEGAAPTPAVRGDYLVECVANARARRLPLLPTEEELDAYRVLSGETEGVPGVTVDRFGAYLVVHLFTPAALTLREPLLDALEQVWRPTGIYEQRRFRPLGGDAPRDPSVLARGAHAPVEVEVREHGARFGVDVTAPLSPGLFPDLRLGRLAVRALARGKRVLNLFSFTGPFTVHALQGGASRVTAVDLSSKAQARARRNLELSGLDREAAELINGDAFKVLHQMKARNRQFDLIVADPPAFASAKDRVFSAVRDYRDLADACCQVLAPGGLLAYASAAAKLTTEELDRSVAEGASRAQLSLQVVQRVGFPPDFPVAPGFPEGNYLKFAIAARPLRSVG